MIVKAILSPNDELSPAILKWDNEKEDFVIEVPKGITRRDLVDLTEAIKRLTEWEQQQAISCAKHNPQANGTQNEMRLEKW